MSLQPARGLSIREIIAWPLRCVLKWGYDNKVLVGTYHGIKLCDIASSNEAQRQLFLNHTIKALELVKRHDARRFQRIRKRLDYVVNFPCLSGAEYSDSLHVCKVDFSKYTFEDDEDWVALVLACTLVHEATHGAIIAWGITYDKKHRLRVERLCHKEDTRFARRVMPEYDWDEFDETWYREYYQTGRWQYALKTFKYAFYRDKPAV